MPSHPISTSTAHLTCLCGAIHEPGTLLASPNFPIDDAPEICHCNPCRYTTGSLGVNFPMLKDRPSERSLKACVAYASSETHNRYFCGTCGTPAFIEVKKGGYWCCLAGVVERDPAQVGEKDQWAEDVVRVVRHDYVDDTRDGGLAARLLRLGGRDVPCWAEEHSDGKGREGRELKKEDVQGVAEAAEKGEVAGKDELMEARCHCGGINLRVTRANFGEDKQGLGPSFSEAGDRYIAQFCACRSCRLQSGVSLQPWTYIPPQNFTVASNGKAVVFGRPGCEEGVNEGTTLKHYWSSRDVCRSFCGRCGASFFYWCDERPEVVDLSMGVIRGKGAMAKEWVSWRWRVSWKEECADREIMEAILGAQAKNETGG